MSLFVNANGRIVLSAGNKPIECLNCPCEEIFANPNVYCVKKEFYSGDGCTGSLLNTLEHQCMCMDLGCAGAWDQITFCQGNVKYTYESGPHFIACPDGCISIPAVCPTNCDDCIVTSFSLVAGSAVVQVAPSVWYRVSWGASGSTFYHPPGQDCVWWGNNSFDYTLEYGDNPSGPWTYDTTLNAGIALSCNTTWNIMTYDISGYLGQNVVMETKVASPCPNGVYANGSVVSP
jgi:hypothetical protein